MDDALITAFCDHLRLRRLSEGSIKLRRERLDPAVRWFRAQGILTPAALTPADIDRFLEYLRTGNRARATIVSYRTSLRVFCRWLTTTGRVLTNPAEDLDPVSSEEAEELPPDPLSVAEVNALITAIPTESVIGLRNRAHTELLYGGGLRLAESLGLDLGDVDMDLGSVSVHGKGDKPRTLPLLPGVAAALRDYLALRRTLLIGPDHGALLVGHDGKRLRASSYRQWLKIHARKELGNNRKCFPHLLRHSFAVHLLLGKADIRHVQELLGHADLDTTRIYLRLLPEELRTDYEWAMPELMGPASDR